MRILRWVAVSFVGVLLAATVTFWVVSYFESCGIYYLGDSIELTSGCAEGRVGLSFRQSSPGRWGIGSGFNWAASPMDTNTREYVRKIYPWGFGFENRWPRGLAIVFPFWLAGALLAGTEWWIIWRMIQARRKRLLPAFQVVPAEGTKHEGTTL